MQLHGLSSVNQSRAQAISVRVYGWNPSSCGDLKCYDDLDFRYEDCSSLITTILTKNIGRARMRGHLDENTISAPRGYFHRAEAQKPPEVR